MSIYLTRKDIARELTEFDLSPRQVGLNEFNWGLAKFRQTVNKRVVRYHKSCIEHIRTILTKASAPRTPKPFVSKPDSPERKIMRQSKRFGVDSAWLTKLFSDTKFCVICQTNFHEQIVKERKPKKPVVDHCHTTGKVRGILCSNCNAILGLALDRPEILKRAADYLERTPGTAVPAQNTK